MAERRWADAVHTLETGFSFSQQVANQPFLIGDLVGIAIANQLLDPDVDEIRRMLAIGAHHIGGDGQALALIGPESGAG